MFKEKLIELKSDLFELIREANRPAHDDDIKIIQEAKLHLRGNAKVVNIQTSHINIQITNNILNIIQKIDDTINEIEQPDLVNNVLESLFDKLLNSGVGVKEIGEQMSYRYLKYARKKEGKLSVVARKTGDNRSTLSMFHKRMTEKDKKNAIQKKED